MERRPPDRAAAYELFRELEFANLTQEFADGAVASARVTAERDYRQIRNKAELDALIQNLWQAETVGFAVSNTSPAGAGQQQSTRDDHGARGIAFSAAAGKSAFVDFDSFAEGKEAAVASMRELFTNGLLEKSVHDLQARDGFVDAVGN